MKRVIAILLVMILCFACCSCGGEKKPVKKNTKDAVTVNGLDYADVSTYVSISAEGKNYHFSNKQNSFPDDFYESLESYTMTSSDKYEMTEHIISVHFENSDYLFVDFYINDKDQIQIQDGNGQQQYYTCDGIYQSILDYLAPTLEDTSKYYVIDQPMDMQTSKYQVFDKKGNILLDDAADRNPHIYVAENDTICFWVQEGAGVQSRVNRFFNWKNGKESPKYAGYTDTFGKYVCVTGADSITIYDIFSGKGVFTYNSFDKPLVTEMDAFQSAYFMENGTKIKVRYLTTDYSPVVQIIDVPAEVMAD